MNTTTASQARSTGRAILQGPGAKSILVGVLVIVFLLPLSLVQRIVDERRMTRDQAEESIIGPAGGKPSLFGPFLALPYDLRKGKETFTGEVIVLADDISMECSFGTETRKRGIFSAPVLAAALEMKGTVSANMAIVADAAPAGARIHWDEARVAIELPDLRALGETPTITWKGGDLTLRPDAGDGRVYARAASARVSVAPGGSYAFSARLKLRGGRGLTFLEPSGAVRASLRGDWPNPSFRGFVSPTERTVSKEGFTAQWYLPEGAQGWPRALDSKSPSLQKLPEAGFGVELLDGIDSYDMSWRAVRYGLLFIIVPFAVLFLFEILSRSRIHPVQYILIGLANCLFYLLLLSLSELTGFAWAYILAALACSLLAGGYAAVALRSRRGLLMLPALGLLYAYLYVALSSEDYALLIGSLGLLTILAAAMVATRKVDWYGRRSPPPTPEKVSDS